MGELGDGTRTGYPAALDTNTTSEVDTGVAGKTKCRADVPNDIASAVVAIETELGTDPAGTLTDVKTFLQTEHDSDGTHQTSSAFMVHKNGTNQSLSATVNTTITWSTEEFDEDNYFANDKYSPTVSGKYLLIAVIQLNISAGTSLTRLRLRKNTTIEAAFHHDVDEASTVTVMISTIVEANGTDTFSIDIKSDAAATVYGDSSKTFFCGYKV